MANETQRKDNHTASPPLSKHGAARRRLAKAGAGAAGVLWTLESKASMTPLMCKSPSGALSGGLSSHYGPEPVCNGRSPGYWKNHDWPLGMDRSKIMFASVFPVGAACSPTQTAPTQSGKSNSKGKPKDKPNDPGQGAPASYQCALLDELLSHQSFDTNNFGMHLVATYLNIKAGLISFITEETLLNIWSEVSMTGVYKPTAGVIWSREQTKQYLESTHD